MKREPIGEEGGKSRGRHEKADILNMSLVQMADKRRRDNDVESSKIEVCIQSFAVTEYLSTLFQFYHTKPTRPYNK